MIWLIFEALLALALFVFIIWWTLPRKRAATRKTSGNVFWISIKTEQPPAAPVCPSRRIVAALFRRAVRTRTSVSGGDVPGQAG